jgi:hypothetical protein
VAIIGSVLSLIKWFKPARRNVEEKTELQDLQSSKPK